MARTGRNGYIYFKKETTWGTYITPDLLLRAGSESLNRAVDHGEDPALVGELYPTDMIKVGDGAGGSLEGALHGDTVGPLAHGVLGSDAVTDPWNSVLIVTANGSNDYIRLSKVSDDLIAEKSSDGSSWSADTDFATTGTMDLSSAPFDTMTEVQAAIDGYTGYSCTLYGDGTADTGNIADFSVTQLKNAGNQVGSIDLKARYSGSTDAKSHRLVPAAATASLPSFTFQVYRSLGTDESVAFTGTKFSSMTITIAAKDLLKVSIAADSKAEEESKTDIAVSIPNVQAFVSYNVKILTVRSTGAQVDFDEVKDLSLAINTNVDDNRVVGSLTKLEQTRQNSTIDYSFTANNTSTQYAVRADYVNDSPVETFIYLESNTECDTTNSIPYSVLIRLPAIKFTDYNSTNSSPDRLTIAGAGSIVKPTNAVYTEHIYLDVVDADTTVY